MKQLRRLIRRIILEGEVKKEFENIDFNFFTENPCLVN